MNNADINKGEWGDIPRPAERGIVYLGRRVQHNS